MEISFIVEVWDLTNLLYPKLKNQNSDNFSNNIIKTFSDSGKVIKKINVQEIHTYFISSIIVNFKSYRIFKSISSNKFKYGCVGPYQTGLVPSLYTNQPFFLRNRNITLGDFFTKILNKLFVNKLSFKIFDIKAADHFFMSGGDNVKVLGHHINDSTKLINIHSANYDFYLDNKNLELKEDYILYIDQYFPFHPDFNFSQQKNTFEKNEFYENLRFFFDKIEKIYDTKVVISAHPRSNYQDKPGLFGNRRLIKNYNSSSAIFNARFVIVHTSNALDFAILYNKQMIFLTSSSFKNTWEGEVIDSYANLFNVESVDCKENFIDLSPYLTNINSYKSYIHKYIKSDTSKNNKFWIQVSDNINSSYN